MHLLHTLGIYLDIFCKLFIDFALIDTTGSLVLKLVKFDFKINHELFTVTLLPLLIKELLPEHLCFSTMIVD